MLPNRASIPKIGIDFELASGAQLEKFIYNTFSLDFINIIIFYIPKLFVKNFFLLLDLQSSFDQNCKRQFRKNKILHILYFNGK